MMVPGARNQFTAPPVVHTQFLKAAIPPFTFAQLPNHPLCSCALAPPGMPDGFGGAVLHRAGALAGLYISVVQNPYSLVSGGGGGSGIDRGAAGGSGGGGGGGSGHGQRAPQPQPPLTLLEGNPEVDPRDDEDTGADGSDGSTAAGPSSSAGVINTHQHTSRAGAYIPAAALVRLLHSADLIGPDGLEIAAKRVRRWCRQLQKRRKQQQQQQQ